MKREDIRTANDLRTFIEENGDVIYVRAKIDGKWGSFNLNEMPDDDAQQFIDGFVHQLRVPVMMKRDV